jgi:hypothetical protein
MRASQVIGWIWRIGVAALWIGALLRFPVEVPGMNWLVDAEVWLTNKVPDPILFAFLTGLLFASWIVPAAWKIFQRRILHAESTRAKLGRMRQVGVDLRNKAQFGFERHEDIQPWMDAVAQWNSDIIGAIRNVSDADAEWFAIADIVEHPRIPMQTTEPNVSDDRSFFLYNLHDFRLLKLEELISGTKGNLLLRK